MKDRTSLRDFKNRMRKDVTDVDEFDLPMIAKWLLKIGEQLEDIENEKK